MAAKQVLEGALHHLTMVQLTKNSIKGEVKL